MEALLGDVVIGVKLSRGLGVMNASRRVEVLEVNGEDCAFPTSEMGLKCPLSAVTPGDYTGPGLLGNRNRQ